MNDASTSASTNSSSINPEPDSSRNDGIRTTPGGSPTAVDDKRRTQKEQKTRFLDDLLRNIDIMIYCELSVLYYMDCSLFVFLLRALPHWFYFTPKPAIIPPAPPGQRPYIGTIFGTNIICMLLHLIFSPTAAGEATRGYLHGGLIIDFVGQTSPVSRWRLLGLDLLCLALQVLMLGVTLEKRGVQGISSAMTTQQGRRQDHDAEEAGTLRSDPMVTEDIQLQTLRPIFTSRQDNTTSDESADLLDTNGELDDAHALDTYYTGEHILANLHILDTIRTQWQSRSVNMDTTTASGMQTAATIAGRRFTVTFGGRERTIGGS